ncbi:MAG: lipocalin family protein [Bacteroidota bacterium]
MKYFISSILFCVFIANAQTRNELYGEWKFESVADEMTADNNKKARVEGLLEGYTYVFYPDNYYEAKMLNVAEKGTWKLIGTSITTITSEGKPGITIEIISLQGDKMKMNTKGMVVNMIKAKAITVPQNLIQKWTFTGTRIDPDDDELRPAPKDNFLDLKADGTYEAAVGQTKETGNWMYVQETKTINLTSNKATKQWPVVLFDDNNLVLRMNTSKSEFVFTHQ